MLNLEPFNIRIVNSLKSKHVDPQTIKSHALSILLENPNLPFEVVNLATYQAVQASHGNVAESLVLSIGIQGNNEFTQNRHYESILKALNIQLRRINKSGCYFRYSASLLRKRKFEFRGTITVEDINFETEIPQCLIDIKPLTSCAQSTVVSKTKLSGFDYEYSDSSSDGEDNQVQQSAYNDECKHDNLAVEPGTVAESNIRHCDHEEGGVASSTTERDYRGNVIPSPSNHQRSAVIIDMDPLRNVRKYKVVDHDGSEAWVDLSASQLLFAKDFASLITLGGQDDTAVAVLDQLTSLQIVKMLKAIKLERD